MNYGMNVRCIVAVEFFSKYADMELVSSQQNMETN
ncbi:hypothetical protein SLEP1_g60156 [Rubroshorea leprosula]|uniref:Uncharacterized protein n=1 Tax=Rubroshorea leprosula TaxID=152421 RepID=A0AAV5L7E0_9ROSI|nr:hypothetical protein SLEP1_g41679 [Rubroshorea leprosula]GKV53638.1 hypothetical protein SLEP1_g60156 [Rubroshorea leprosula]